ncbi:MAG: cytochrome P450 [Stagnimonas sp.]|nr:cytochrome P450 [Stagnimonas sp.]
MALPGPPDSAFSQLGRLRKDFFGYLIDAASYGDLVQLKPAPGVGIVLVNHPDLVEQVLVTDAARYRKSRSTQRMVGKFLGQGLVLSEGETHRRARRAVQPAFHGTRLAALIPQMTEVAQDWLARWPKGERRALPEALSQLMLQVVARTLFGLHESQGNEPVAAAMAQFAESMAQRFRSIPLPDWLPLPRHRREWRAIAALDAAVSELLAQPIRGGDDFLNLLRSEPGFDAQAVRDHIVTLYFAGHETTAKLLAWTCWRLQHHPDIADIVRAELAALASPDEAAIPGRVPHTEALLKEVLRLHPSTWVFDRETLGEVSLGGHRLRRGTVLYLSPYVSHRDARTFAEPGRFDPQRFAASATAPARGAYYPFGFGPRNCIGRGFSESAARVLLAVLLPHLTLQCDAEPKPVAGATLGMSADALFATRR